jgi:uncharacterized membrane protein YkvA (DUF1232 family)
LEQASILDRIKQYTAAFKRELNVYRAVLADKRTPWYAKAILGLAVAYLMMPFDLIPDAIPLLGQLDDLVLVPGMVWLSLRFIPEQVVLDARQQVDSQQK